MVEDTNIVSRVWERVRDLYEDYQDILRWASAILIIVLIFMTAADINGVSGDILLLIGISVFGLVTLSVWFRYAGLITGAGALATRSAGTRRLMGFLISLSTIPVLWALLLWAIPFENDPSSAVRLLASIIGLVGIMAFPTEWLGNGGGVRFIKIVLVIGLILAVILFGLAAFGITLGDIGNGAQSSWDWTQEQWFQSEKPAVVAATAVSTTVVAAPTTRALESEAACPESREIQMPQVAHQTITLPPNGCPSDWYVMPTYYDQSTTWHAGAQGTVLFETLLEGPWIESPGGEDKDLSLERGNSVWRATWKGGSNVIILTMEW